MPCANDHAAAVSARLSSSGCHPARWRSSTTARTYPSIGLLLGLLWPTARAAQGIGLTLFFPSFLLGGAGPPTNVMPPVMRTIANVLPMTHVVRAIQHPWLSIGDSSTTDLVVLVGFTVASTAGWVALANRNRV